MAEHARLSASASKRWMSCPPSARLEAQYPDTATSYAEEGTFAHKLAETLLRQWSAPGMSRKAKAEQIRALEQDPHYSKGLEEYVMDYVGLVQGRYREARRHSRDAYVGMERRVDFSDWVPEGFGTADAIIIADGVMEVVDLKYGQGVRVTAAENPQIRLYALGALAEYDYLYDIRAVRMTICQPRVPDGTTTEEMTAAALREWAEAELVPRAQLAAAGAGEFCAGDWCIFCKHRAKCRARSQEALRIVREDFAGEDPASLSPEERSRALQQADGYIRWIKDLQQAALEDVLAGNPLPGWKAVEGRSSRRYSDPEKVAAALLGAGYDAAVLYAPRELLGLTAMEAAIGKQKLEEIAGEFIVKPQGSPALAPESDPRPALKNDSKKAFEEETIDE